MANQEKVFETEEQTTINKVITVGIVVAIVCIWLGVLALLIKLDVGGFGSGALRPVLKDIPIINRILPSVSEEQIAEENDYPYKNYTQAVARIKELEKQLNAYQTKHKDQEETIHDLESEVERLKVFEENQLTYEKNRREFEEEIVFGEKAPDISEYRKYYEEIDPAHAEELYQQVIKQQQISEEIKNQATRFSKMKPAEAAAILETMTEDLTLVGNILKNMRTKDSGAILSQMSPTNAAKIVKKMSRMQ